MARRSSGKSTKRDSSWAAIRALTLPPKNGCPPYPFGFTIAGAGVYDLVRAYGTVNIPGWVDIEWGSPTAQAPQLKDQSPLNHAARLQGKVLLYHGENDNCIPVEETQTMHAAFTKLGKDSTLEVFKGQGHGWSDAANVKRLLEARYQFLEQVVR